MELDPQEGENVAETSRKEDKGKSGDIIEYAMEPTKLLAARNKNLLLNFTDYSWFQTP